MKRSLIVALVAVAVVPSANATPGTAAGALAFGAGASIACDHLVRSYMDATPESDEPWYFVWHHVGKEDLAGFAAGTACAIPAAAAGAAVGLVAETAVVGTSVAVAGGGAIALTAKGVAKGVDHATRALAPAARVAVQPVRQWFGKIKLGSVAYSSNRLRRLHMEPLYAKQKGMDALCNKVPLPPLYVGPLWNRKLNPAIQVDHKIPRAKGGSDDPSNLQLTAAEYNQKKGTKTGSELRQLQRRMCPI